VKDTCKRNKSFAKSTSRQHRGRGDRIKMDLKEMGANI